MRILIANRGEIARRVIRTAHRLGYETVAVYADPDRGAPFVREATLAEHLGPADLASSYLSTQRIIDAAARSGASAIHPGYGFLSERADFARDVARAGLVWVGPHPEAIEGMGSKIAARGLAVAAGVPTLPGYDESQAPRDLAAAAERIGYPVLIKAASGGGGKGIRIVREADAFAAALSEAKSEAERSFGDADVIVERYVERARHVEVQIVGDRHGATIDLGTRECSVQRRYQKLLEEAPAPNLPDATRAGLRESARKLAQAIGYDSTGTVEFVVDDTSGEFFFLEMNTRLQVEHPVTEAITGLDLVELQLRCAQGEPLPIAQGDVHFSGHAIEARINAEDASNGFAPQIGRISLLHIPKGEGLRWDSGIEAGSEITPHYDPMLAKLIAHASDRDAALRRLAAALDEIVLGGVITNTGFQRWLLEQAPVRAGRVTTSFLDACEVPADDGADEAARTAARAWRAALAHEHRAAGRTGPWSALGAFRVTPHGPSVELALCDGRGTRHSISAADSAGGVARRGVAIDVAARKVAVNLRGHCHSFDVLTRSEAWAPARGAEFGDASDATRSPFPAVVAETPVAAGDSVEGGDVVVVIEAMKMLHSLTARGVGTVAKVHVAVGDSVDSNQVLVSYATAEPRDGEAGGN